MTTLKARLARCDAQCKEYEEGNRFLRARLAAASTEVARVEKLLGDLQAAADTIALIKEELAVSLRRLS